MTSHTSVPTFDGLPRRRGGATFVVVGIWLVVLFVFVASLAATARGPALTPPGGMARLPCPPTCVPKAG
jgi:hypothetical protein